MRIAKTFVALAATTLMLFACASQKEPAEKAMAQAESSLAEFRADAEKYAAEELQGSTNPSPSSRPASPARTISMVVMAAPRWLHGRSLKQSVATKKADMPKR